MRPIPLHTRYQLLPVMQGAEVAFLTSPPTVKVALRSQVTVGNPAYKETQMSSEKHEPTIEALLLSTTGLPNTEVDNITRLLRPLEARVKSYRPGSVELHLVAKDFDTRQQKLILEARIDGHKTLVATSQHMELQKAIKEVREDLMRLMTDAITKTEPRNNRTLRETEQ